MFGWESAANAFASRSNLPRKSGSSPQFIGKDFDGDPSVELGVPRFTHLTHPTGADGGDDVVGTQLGSGLKRHLRRPDSSWVRNNVQTRQLMPTHQERFFWRRGDASDLQVSDTHFGKLG